MILLSSSAQKFFWLGRYLTRVQYLCSQFPFKKDAVAQQYAQAFALPAYDARSLNELVLDSTQHASFAQQFQHTIDNVQDLRAVLSSSAYAELNQLIKNANENAAFICDVVGECHDILEAEAPDIFLFFSLGRYIEQVDRELRLHQDIQGSQLQLQKIVTLLQDLGWTGLDETWQSFQIQPRWNTFADFVQNVQLLFEADA